MKITVENMKEDNFMDGIKIAARMKKPGERLYARAGKNWVEGLLHLAGMAAMSESEMEKELERMERMFAHE